MWWILTAEEGERLARRGELRDGEVHAVGLEGRLGLGLRSKR